MKLLVRILPILLLLLISSTVFAQDVVPIGEIQGSGGSTPFENRTVSFEGIVTGRFARRGGSGALNWVIFVQDAPGSEDGDPATSDGIAIYVGQEEPSYAIGDFVSVRGKVVEFYDLTEISDTSMTIEVLSSDNPLPAAVRIETDTPLEPLEAMLVAIENETVLSPASCQYYVAHAEFDMPVVGATPTGCDSFEVPARDSVVAQAIGPLHYNFDEYKLVVQEQPLVAEIVAAVAPPAALVDGFRLPALANGLSAVNTLLVTELYYQLPGLEQDVEWVELTNIGDKTLNIGRFKLGDAEVRDDNEGFFRFPDEATVPAGASIVVANSAELFRQNFTFLPNYELTDSNPDVPTLPVVPALGTSQFALANDGDELIVLDQDNAFVTGLSYGDSTAVFEPPVGRVGDGESIGRNLDNCGNSPFDFQPQREPTPGLVELDGKCSAESLAVAQAIADASANADLLPIGQIQGDGGVSPFVGRDIATEGVVTAIHEDQNSAGIVFYTLYIQDPPGREDGDPATSDGLPVFLARRRPQAQIGDLVRVRGEMTEYFGLSEVDDNGVQIEVISSGNVLPTPIEISPPNVSAAELEPLLEQLEGMRVHLGFEPARVVGPTFDGCGLSVVRRDSGVERPFRRSIDDPIGAVVPILNHSDVACPDMPKVKTGDELSGLSGVLTYNFEQYKILVSDYSDVIWDEAPFVEPPVAPAAAEGEFSVISYNVENFFDGIDDTGDDGAEPKLSDEEIATKRDKIAYAIGVTASCPTVIAIQEVEKASLLELLAEKLLDYCDAPYAVVHEESADGRGIDVAYMVDADRVGVISAELNQSCTPITTNIEDPTIDCGRTQDPLFSRPPYVLTADIDGETFTFINNHFKSKRGGESETEPRRILQANHVASIVNEFKASDPDAQVLVIGDMNDYENSKALLELEKSGLVNILNQVPEAERYSFVFSGVSQLIDGILTTPSMAQRLVNTTILHSNADYPDALGSELSPDRIAFKATDHDMPLAIFALADEAQVESEAIAVEPTSEPIVVDAQNAEDAEIIDDNGLVIGAAVGGVVVAGAVGFLYGRRKRS